MLKKVISGAQTGADLAGLEAADECGLETGGWMPKGFLNETGSCPELGTQFGLQEHTSAKYSPRTYTNVRDSDGTIRFAHNFNSPGEKCTLKAIKQYKKPYMDVQIEFDDNFSDATFYPEDPKEIAMWIKENDIEVLNIAGNRESTCPGGEVLITQHLVKVFKELRG